MTNPTDLKYTETHEWVRLEGSVATVGITAHAAESLSDLVFLDLPEVGTVVSSGDNFGEVESVKAVSDLSSPVDGTIVEVNESLQDDLSTINTDPYGGGWLIRVETTGTSDGLLDAEAYDTLVAAEQA